MKKYPFIFCLSMLILMGCTKQIEFTGEESDPMPVMVSYAEADSTLRVRMTMSRFFLSSDTVKPIDNAVFNVELNGGTPNARFFYQGKSMYGSSLLLHEGDTLTLHATVPGYGEVKAGCRVPQRPNVTDIIVTKDDVYVDTLWSGMPYDSDISNIYFYGEIGFKFTLADRPGQDDYYLVKAYMIKDSTGKRKPLTVSVDDDLIYEDAMSDDILGIGTTVDLSYGTNVIFTDNNINGRRHAIEGKVMIDGYGSYDCDTNLRVWIEVCAVSRDTYLYLATVKAQSYSDDEMGFLSEPVQIHTNVEGGIGILGAVTPVRYTLFPTESDALNHANTHNR